MIAPYGSVVCHYTRSATAFDRILANKTFRLSPYSLMRDPTESQPWVFAAAFFPDNFDSRGDEAQTYDLARRAMNELKERTKLLSLTEDAPSPDYRDGGLKAQMFGRGWARARMWELYGEDHRGACLVFDRELLDAELRKGFAGVGAGGPYAGAVTYTPAGIAEARGALTLHLDNFKTKPFEQAFSEHLEQHYRELFLLKARDWESEHEVRYVAHTQDVDPLFVPFEDALKAVVVGWEFPDSGVARAREACRRAMTPLYRLKWLHEGPWPVDLS